MTNKWKPSKLGLTLIAYFAIAIGIGMFSYGFLSTTSLAVAQRAVEKNNIMVEELDKKDIGYWIEMPSFLGAAVVTISILLFMIKEKLSYIISINKSIQSLEGGNLSERVEILGDDELADLAESINSMAIAIESHIDNEEILKKKNAEMVSALSHDIRTPLTSIISYIDFIKEGKCDDIEKQNKYLDIIQSKAYQIKSITDELFERATMMNREGFEEEIVYTNDNKIIKSNPNKKESIDCGLLIIQIIDEKQDELEEQGFSINLEIGNLRSFNMEVDINDMNRIFDNICSNISKYADKNHRIYFKIENTDEKLFINESNYIDESEKAVESHGIGIKSCKNIILSYGGRIDTQVNSNVFEINIEIPLNIY